MNNVLKPLICICPENEWFFFINSSPPKFRKAAQAVVEVAAHEVLPLSNPTSYIDTTSVEAFLDNRVAVALASGDQYYGPLLLSVRVRIREAVREHGALNAEKIEAVEAD